VRSGGETRCTSSSLTTPSDSNERGCSGSDIGAIKSVKRQRGDRALVVIAESSTQVDTTRIVLSNKQLENMTMQRRERAVIVQAWKV
jgi:hypothetical protein